MNDSTIYRWTGLFGLAVFVITLLEFPLYMAGGEAPVFQNAALFSEFVTNSSQFFLMRIFLDILLIVCYLVFLTGFRHLIIKSNQAWEFMATLSYGAGLALVAITLVGDSMQAGVALDTIGATADPSVLRGLTEAYLLIYGSAGCSLIALNSITAGLAILGSGALPKWSGRVAIIVGILNVLMIPSMFGGSDPTMFYSAAGWGVAVTATFPWVILVLIVSLLMVRKKAD